MRDGYQNAWGGGVLEEQIGLMTPYHKLHTNSSNQGRKYNLPSQSIQCRRVVKNDES